ncbi:MAG: hypothetical protein ACXWCM_03405 [Acidimicrobiales bacterium]
MSHDLPSQQRHESIQLDALRAVGYEADFEIGRSGLAISGGDPVPIADVHIDGEYRFEGASDPDDESMVIALHDAVSGRLGVLVTAYGPSASEAEAEVLAALAVNERCATPAAPRSLA